MVEVAMWDEREREREREREVTGVISEEWDEKINEPIIKREVM